jgi:hypothetical protein
MLLTDISAEHIFTATKGGPRVTILVHPFTNTQRDSLGKFEIVRNIREPGAKEVKRSTFVSFQQLAELYAKGVLDEFGFSVRMCAADGKHPKRPRPRSCSRAASNQAHPLTWRCKAWMSLYPRTAK